MEWFDVGYSDGTVDYNSDEERIEKSEEFWSSYVEWKAADNLRDLLGDDSGPTTALDLDEQLDLLRQGDPTEKEGAARQLGGIQPGPGISLADLSELLGDGSSLVRFWAATVLGRYGSAAVAAVEGLRQGLEDHSWPVRYACAQVLDQLGDRESADSVAAIFAQKDATVEPWPRFERRETADGEVKDETGKDNGSATAAPGGGESH